MEPAQAKRNSLLNRSVAYSATQRVSSSEISQSKTSCSQRSFFKKSQKLFNFPKNSCKDVNTPIACMARINNLMKFISDSDFMVVAFFPGSNRVISSLRRESGEYNTRLARNNPARSRLVANDSFHWVVNLPPRGTGLVVLFGTGDGPMESASIQATLPRKLLLPTVCSVLQSFSCREISCLKPSNLQRIDAFRDNTLTTPLCSDESFFQYLLANEKVCSYRLPVTKTQQQMFARFVGTVGRFLQNTDFRKTRPSKTSVSIVVGVLDFCLPSQNNKGSVACFETKPRSLYVDRFTKQRKGVSKKQRVTCSFYLPLYTTKSCRATSYADNGGA